MCSLCQNGTVELWSDWIAECPVNETAISIYPFIAPTNIPAWAFYDSSASNVFDPTIAAQQPLNTNSSERYPNDVSKTVGGVIGGAIGLVLIVGLVLCILHRRNRRHRHLYAAPQTSVAPPQHMSTPVQPRIRAVSHSPNVATTSPQITPRSAVIPLSSGSRIYSQSAPTLHQPTPHRIRRKPVPGQSQSSFEPTPQSSGVGFASGEGRIPPRLEQAEPESALSGPSQ